MTSSTSTLHTLTTWWLEESCEKKTARRWISDIVICGSHDRWRSQKLSLRSYFVVISLSPFQTIAKREEKKGEKCRNDIIAHLLLMGASIKWSLRIGPRLLAVPFSRVEQPSKSRDRRSTERAKVMQVFASFSLTELVFVASSPARLTEKGKPAVLLGPSHHFQYGQDTSL